MGDEHIAQNCPGELEQLDLDAAHDHEDSVEHAARVEVGDNEPLSEGNFYERPLSNPDG